jgi:hypothetical protein
MATDRRVPLTAKVTPALRTRVRAAAKEKGVTVSAFLEDLAHRHTPVTDGALGRPVDVDPGNMKLPPQVPVDTKPAKVRAAKKVAKVTKAGKVTTVTKVGPTPTSQTRRPFCPHPINRVRDGICGRCGGKA